jgi:hypothetical protein
MPEVKAAHTLRSYLPGLNYLAYSLASSEYLGLLRYSRVCNARVILLAILLYSFRLPVSGRPSPLPARHTFQTAIADLCNSA